MSAGVSPVPDEAVEAAAAAIWGERDQKWKDAPADWRDRYVETARAAIAAALPSLREGIAAEVLGPVREEPDYWAVREVVNRGRHWHRLTDLAAENDARALMADLSAPVQAAEEVGGDDD